MYLIPKIPDAPNPPFDLSDDFTEISKFLGLSLPTFQEGFKTKRDVFKWAASCKYFDPSQFRTSGPGITKVKSERTMYAEFVEWVEETRKLEQFSTSAPLSREDRYAKTREEALIFFNKKEEFNALVKARFNRLRLKESFSGSRVRDWTELGEYWKGVKLVMDEVRVRLGGEEGIVGLLDEHGEDELRKVVLQAKADLGLASQGPQLQNLEESPDVVTSNASVLAKKVEEVSLTE